jgi:hypothetical protein
MKIVQWLEKFKKEEEVKGAENWARGEKFFLVWTFVFG